MPLTNILSSPYCTSFIETGGGAVASKLNLPLKDYTQFCSGMFVGCAVAANHPAERILPAAAGRLVAKC